MAPKMARSRMVARCGAAVLPLLLGSCGSTESNAGPTGSGSSEAGTPDTSVHPDAGGSTPDAGADTSRTPESGFDTSAPNPQDGAVADRSADGGARDASDAATREGGPVAVGDGGPCSSHELGDPNCWSVFDTITLHPSGSFFGGALDGRYVYFVSSAGTTGNHVTRYDTQASFASSSSWSSFNLSTVNTVTGSFEGAAFDGRYMYVVPFSPAYNSVISRYDTQGTFGAATSWSNFDLNTANGHRPNYDSQAYVGAAFDGRYVYLVPNCQYEYWRGQVMRYDTKAAFDAVGSWSAFDTLTLDANAGGFRGVAFDGRYLYFVPWGDLSTGTPLQKPIVTRYDTQATFTDATSWATFDATGVSDTIAFVGAAFDGRYVYFPPGDYRGKLTRYDTQASFTSTTSWSAFSMTTLSPGARSPYQGATFDGRYVYVVPTGSTVVRYDSQAAFAAPGSWSAYDVATLDSRATGFAGGVFDGRFVYLVPATSNLVVRFEARSTTSIPPGNGASFF